MPSPVHILLIPGTESPAEVAFSGLKPLLERDYTVHLGDFSSKSNIDPDSQLELYVGQVKAIINDSIPEGERLHVLGYSLGSLIAVRLAAQSDGRVDSLVLLGAWLRPSQPQRARHELWLKLFDREPILAGEFSHLLQYSSEYLNLVHEQQTPVKLTASVPTDEIRHRVNVNLETDNSDPASRVRCRTLIINGIADQKVPQYCGFELLGVMKPSQLALVKAGHSLLTERLGEVYGLVNDFVNQTLPDQPVILPKQV